MSKVLKITKPDKTVHVVPTSNHAFYLANNNRLPEGAKWKIEEIEEEQAKDLPFIDESFVTPLEAQAKVADLQKESEEKDKEIEELRAKLDAIQKAQLVDPTAGTADQGSDAEKGNKKK